MRYDAIRRASACLCSVLFDIPGLRRCRHLACVLLAAALLVAAPGCKGGGNIPSAKPASDVQASLPDSFQWTSTGPLIRPIPDRFHPILSVKDPTVVFFEDRWHVFATTADESGTWSMIYLNFRDWSEAAQAQPYYLDENPALRGYHAAPQVFYFRPHEKWYLIFQSGQPQYTTTDDIADPESWVKPRDFFPDGEPEIVTRNKGQGTWLDFWIICESKSCHLFFTDDNGHLYRSETDIDDFPEGFQEPEIAIDGTKETLFEGNATYRVGQDGGYLTLVEAFGNAGERYYRSFVADRLDGEWSPHAATLENPFAAVSHVTFPNGQWTTEISHGELLRDGYDESLTIDPANLRFLYQGVDGATATGEYFERRYRLGLLALGEGDDDFANLGARSDGSADGAGSGGTATETLIDVASMSPRFVCYASEKQSLNPPPENDETCPAASDTAEVEVSDEDGNPPPSLRFEIPFNDYNQFVEVEWDIPAAHRDLTGKRLVLALKVVEPGFENAMCPGGIRFFVKTGANYVYGSAPWITTPGSASDTFREYALDLENAELGTGVESLDLGDVRRVGLAFESADCGGAYPPGKALSDGSDPPSTAVFFVDDILMEQG